MDSNQFKKDLGKNRRLIYRTLPLLGIFSKLSLEGSISLDLAGIKLSSYAVDIKLGDITAIRIEGKSFLCVLVIDANGKSHQFGYLLKTQAKKILDVIQSHIDFNNELAERSDYYLEKILGIKYQLAIQKVSLLESDSEEAPSAQTKDKINILKKDLQDVDDSVFINQELKKLYVQVNAELSFVKEIIKVREYYLVFSEKLSILHHHVLNLEDFKFYLTEDLSHQIYTLISEVPSLTDLEGFDCQLLVEPDKYKNQVEKVSYYLVNPDIDRKAYNAKFVEIELAKYKEFFDTVSGASLTHEQRLAIIKDDHRNLVIAAAGSGKTSVIKAKILYLVTKELASPYEILVLAFNRDAVDEIKLRLGEQLSEAIHVNTFHGYGLSVISEAVGVKPSLSVLAENTNLTREHLNKWLVELVLDPKHSRHIKRFFLKQLYENIKVEQFESLGDYYKRLKRIEPQSIFGTQVKSFEEAVIATFLEYNQINYEYESNYKHSTADRYRKQYQPDFYLSGYDIYLEHFAIKSDGSSHFGEKYVQSMQWKRELHQQYKTRLVESYSYESNDDQLLSNLHHRLLRQGVEFSPMPAEKLAERLKESPIISVLSSLLHAFLNQFKSSGYELSNLPVIASQKGLNTDRFDAFMTIFTEIYGRYQGLLTERNEIDFNDMITEAAKHLENKKVASFYKYILVDEFQDISPSRATLVEETLKLDKSTKLFCVGDDWQAINRFAGGDSSIMRNFKKYFGFYEKSFLTKSFRFNNKISIPSSDFVTKNPHQIKKDLKVTKTVQDKRLVLIKPKLDEELPIEDALRRISDEFGGSVLILGRYNFETKNLNLRILSSKFPDLDLKKMTVHSSKGLEADYVIIVGMRSGLYGFPSEITDDPLLEVIPAQLDDFDNAEERRLLYVALTRARERVFLICDPRSESSFVDELSLREDVELDGYFGEEVYCPECKSGRIHQKSGAYGIFFSCVNFPYCEYKATTCSSCANGFLHFDEEMNIYKCSNKNCNSTYEVCPKCKTGSVMLRSGPSGDFYGCSNFKASNCRYNRKVEISNNLN